MLCANPFILYRDRQIPFPFLLTFRLTGMDLPVFVWKLILLQYKTRELKVVKWHQISGEPLSIIPCVSAIKVFFQQADLITEKYYIMMVLAWLCACMPVCVFLLFISKQIVFNACLDKNRAWSKSGKNLSWFHLKGHSSSFLLPKKLHSYDWTTWKIKYNGLHWKTWPKILN